MSRLNVTGLDELVAELSARLASCLPEEIDLAIQRGLGATLRLLNANRVCWYVKRPDAPELFRVYSVVAYGLPPSPASISPDEMPYTADRLMRGETVLLNGLTDLPQAADSDRHFFERQSVASIALIPSTCDTADRGLLGVTFAASQDWQPALVNQLEVLGNLIVSTVQRKIAHEAREESERLFRYLFEEASIGIAIEDLEGRLLLVNPALCAMLGYTSAELLGMHCSQFEDQAAQDDPEPFQELAAGRIHGYSLEKRYRRKDGGEIWGRLRVSLLKRNHRRPALVVAMVDDISHQKVTDAELRRAQVELQQLTARLIRAQDDERSRISRELHDDIGQRLSLVAIELDSLRLSFAASQTTERKQVMKVRQSVDELASDIHQLSRELHSTKLRHLGLGSAIKELCQQLAKQYQIQIDREYDVEAEPLDADVAMCLFRVTQEALNNVVRHSHAKSASVELTRLGDLIRLRIRDSGQGFEPALSSGGIGLLSMRERLRIVGGHLVINSWPTRGTEVIAEVRLPKGGVSASV